MKKQDPPTGPQQGASPSVPFVHRHAVPAVPEAEHNDDSGRVSLPTTPKYEAVDHPAHYGGKDDPYEAVKVIEAWGLNFNLGNCVKYINRRMRKPSTDMLEDLKKAMWYLNREIENTKKKFNDA